MGNFVSIGGGSGFDPENANLVNLAITGGLNLQGSWGTPGQVVTSNGETNIFWSDGSSSSNGVTSAQLAANLLNYELIANLSGDVATLTANDTSFVGTTSAANVVSNAQLTANLANYTTTTALVSLAYVNTAQLTANLANYYLASNPSGYISSIPGTYVNSAQLSANLANYTNTAGLPAVVTTLTANDTLFVGTTSAANVVSNTQLAANLANYTTTAALVALAYVNTAQLTSNLANYQTTAGLASNVAGLTSNNSTNFAGQAQGYYANISGPIFTTFANVGSNVSINTSALSIGNSTVNTIISSTAYQSGNSTVYTLANSTTDVWVGASSNAVVNATNYLLGNSTIYTTGNSTADIFVGLNTNVTINSSALLIGNATVSATVNSTVFSGTANNSTNFAGQAQGYYANITNPNFTTSINVSTFQVNTSQITHGNLPISANGSLGTAGWVLTTSGGNNYWAPVSVAAPGSTTDVTFNDAGVINATAGFTFDKTTNSVSISGNSLTLGTSSIASAGHSFLPNGLILQWGTSTQTTGIGSVTFPIAFPTGCFSVTMTMQSATGLGILEATSVTASGFSPRSSNTSTSTAYWMAIGH
jgi:hypothetical protein